VGVALDSGEGLSLRPANLLAEGEVAALPPPAGTATSAAPANGRGAAGAERRADVPPSAEVDSEEEADAQEAARAPRQLPPPPTSTSTSGGLGAAYRQWDRFDEVEALTTLENEGKPGAHPRDRT
jgi:hypothetical protein